MNLNKFNTNLDCAACLEWYNASGAVVKTVKLKQAVVNILRNEFRELLLTVQAKTASHKFMLKSVSVFKKFAHEGKASLRFQDPKLSLMISNAPAAQLTAFLKILFVKLTSSESSPKPTLRHKLLSAKDKILDEVSPVNKKDMDRTSQHLQVKGVKRPIDAPHRESKKICLNSVTNLNTEQKAILDTVISGSNIFFTGSAGTGKSHLLKIIINSLPPEVTVATASTGAAACLIGGITLHSFAGVGTGEDSLARSLQLASRPVTSQNWKKCRHLIIDEISMIDAPFFERIERVAREVRASDKPFGGIQVIVCGDFLQLPPVSKAAKKFCFQSEAWETCRFRYHLLTQVHRQADPLFIDILNSIRVGKMNDDISRVLQETGSQDIECSGVLATRLCSHTKDARAINQSKLEQLSGVSKTYDSIDFPPTASKILDDCTPINKSIVLKVGAQVMLLKNISVAKGLVNGARGIVEKFVNGDPVVRFLCGEEYTVKYEKWVVKGPNGSSFSRKQIPLRLAWAFSIHKSQGLTLDCVEMCLDRIFEAGQAYVALSRAKSLKSLRVVGFQPNQVWADVEVLRFYRKFNSHVQEYVALGRPKQTTLQPLVNKSSKKKLHYSS